MFIMDNKDIDLLILQDRYSDITCMLNNLQNHIIYLDKSHILVSSELNLVYSKIFEISKSLNTKYNNYLNNKTKIEIEDINIEDIKNYYKLINKSLPLEVCYQNLLTIINLYGYNSIKNILKLNKVYESLDVKTKELINELENIVHILEYKIEKGKVKDIKFEDYKENENDYLEKSKILKFKHPYITGHYIELKILFKIDKLTTTIKTSQINHKYLHNKKLEIMEMMDNQYFDIDTKFVKSFIRHDYLGNIYSKTVKTYCEFIKNEYFKYLELLDSSFLTLMKDFISKTKDIKEIFNIIFLLLLGDDDTCDMATLLVGLIKERKNQMINLYLFIVDNLTYYLQLKLKKSEINIKTEFDKLKNLSNEEIDYKKQLALNKTVPDNVRSMVLEKIDEMKSNNNEYYKQLTYVKTILSYPWKSDSSIFNILSKDINKSKKYLEEIENKLKNSSYGHEESKKSLLQIIGKWISNPDSQGSCLGLVGPPGVGKTLLAKSLSKSLDIPFAQINLGGQNDGELLHGHGYTYSGSQPGMIVRKMVEMGKSRCIIYFDELDKTTSKNSNINEISSILIHLTDPNMSKTFQDRFFQGIDFPLDKVIFIFSYNDSSLVDPILLDRIKEIKVDPYTPKDKYEICKNFIIPELEEAINFKDKLVFTKDIIEYIIDNYTNEAGVRSIKRLLEKIYLNLNLDKIYKRNLFKKNKNKIKLTKKNIIDILGNPKSEEEKIHSNPEVGIINGLYATTNGDGGIIPIQVFNNLPSSVENFDIKLTGKQGDVMKESVLCSLTTALNYLRNNKNKYKIKDLDKYLKDNFKYGFHVHCPSTSTPKDGPSAGCAFTTAFISRILNKPINNTVGMTGEIELTGKITKIGGLNYKLIGAKKAGVKTIYVSKENSKDVEEIKKKYPKLIDKDLSVHLVDNISEFIDDIIQ